MTSQKMNSGEPERLENLWAGEFGNAYTDRNRAAGDGRKTFWKEILKLFPSARMLEVGCNMGVNLRWIASLIDPRGVYGLDVNLKALGEVRHSLPEVSAIYGSARELPFRDNWFDLVFTTGVLIHLPPEVVPEAMSEIVRCSRRYVLCGEYYSETPSAISYRGQEGALFKQDFGALYQKLFPALRLVKKGFLARETGGWDDLTFWVFEK